MPAPDYRVKHFRKRNDDTPRSTLSISERNSISQQRYVMSKSTDVRRGYAFSPSMLERAERISSAMDTKSIGEVIRRSLELADTLYQAKNRGAQIALTEPDGSKSILTLL